MNVTDDAKLRDNLMHCTEKAMHRALCVRVETIKVADLLREKETIAVLKQSKHVNILGMLKSKQERAEPVRHFDAQLHGLAAIVCVTSQPCAPAAKRCPWWPRG